MPDESAPPQWIDTHCHLDAREFDADRALVVERASAAGVTMQVIPAVGVFNFDRVRALAHEHRLSYALGIHPLCVGDAPDARGMPGNTSAAPLPCGMSEVDPTGVNRFGKSG